MGRNGAGLSGEGGQGMFCTSTISRLRVSILLGALLCLAIWAESLGDGFIDHMPVPFVVVELAEINIRSDDWQEYHLTSAR